MDEPRRDIAAGLLAWYREMGVDAVVSDDTVNWLERGAAAPGEAVRKALAASPAEVAPHPIAPAAVAIPLAAAPARAATTARPAVAASAPQARVFATGPPDAAETAARAAARKAQSIDELCAAIDAFDGCGLKATASRSCIYRGAAQARLMIVGEAPGRDEDLAGKPFVGRAGQLLDKMLAAIGLGEDGVHITNIVYWRPPGNRTPTPHEAQVCRPFLERQIEFVRPDIVLPLGGPAAKHLLDVADGIMRIRGKWRDIAVGQHRARALPSLHPAYLLRTPAAKRLAWQDLLAIKAALDGR
jgi:DNA polymerase